MLVHISTVEVLVDLHKGLASDIAVVPHVSCMGIQTLPFLFGIFLLLFFILVLNLISIPEI